mgnify:CR=1 FL=1
MKKIFVIVSLALCSTITALCDDIPYLMGRVNDYAGILSESAANSMGIILKSHETRTSNQVVVLTVNSLDGVSIEDFSNRVFNEWKLGQKDRDNGILIVVVPDERRMRIEVGYGLEGVLPDIAAGRIIQNIMAPRFREGDYDGGITAGVNAVVNILEGGEEPAYESGIAERSSFFDNQMSDMPIGMRILIGEFIFGPLLVFTILGIMTPGMGWFLYFFLIPFWATFPVFVLGPRGTLVIFILYLVIYPLTKIFFKRMPWYEKATNDLLTKGYADVGGFTLSSGSSGGSWSSGNSFSGGGRRSGGFSGGGGSSGGGGASGRW